MTSGHVIEQRPTSTAENERLLTRGVFLISSRVVHDLDGSNLFPLSMDKVELYLETPKRFFQIFHCEPQTINDLSALSLSWRPYGKIKYLT